jgi:hypothetical protein
MTPDTPELSLLKGVPILGGLAGICGDIIDYHMKGSYAVQLYTEVRQR